MLTTAVLRRKFWAIFCASSPAQLTTTCKNAITSSDALGGTYRLIFDSCGVSYSGCAQHD